MSAQPAPGSPALKGRAVPAMMYPGCAGQAPGWRVLVVDRDPDVHMAIRGALEGLEFSGRSLSFMHAYSDSEARALLEREHDVAVAMLEMGGGRAAGTGLGLVDFIRHHAGLSNTRIVLRMDGAEHAPSLGTLLRYDIDDYRARSELTQDRLLTMVITAVRSYEQRCAIDAHRRSLERIVRSGVALLEEMDSHAFAAQAIAQLSGILGVPAQGMVCVQQAQSARPDDPYYLLAAEGTFAGLGGCLLEAIPDSRAKRLMHEAILSEQGICGDDGGIALYIPRRERQGMVVFVEMPQPGSAVDRQLLDVFCVNLRTVLHNRDLLGRLHRFAFHDPLVQLPNRVHFVEKVDECVRRGGMHNHILALIDIDDFSAANDVMGHRFGDRLLDAVARRLADALPPGVLLARVGSDTFGVLGEDWQVGLPQLLECVRPAPMVDGVPHKVSLTCGYVYLPHAAQAGADLVKDATIALKRAKRHHRGQHLQYLDHMGAEARDRALLLSDLRTAIDKGQLFLVYQPQLSLATRELVGLEALLRWRTAEGRLVAPEQFIPVAEHSGLIVELGEWVLATACKAMRELLDAGRAPQRMAVNVSVVQLQDSGFLEMVRAALSACGLQGEQLELEITESIAIPTQLLESTLNALRNAGVSIAIDDFGTGYSSLSYLERLPLDRIKIDRAFVRQLGEPHGARIAEMVVQLGRKLGLRVMAEGIEDAAVWETLAGMGCDEGQGYYIARPMEQDQLSKWLQMCPSL